MLKMLVSFLMGTIGIFMLLRGKKIENPRMMVIGGVLLLLSYVLF
jgi:hypothetical protein